jgi:nucleotide-binding universal stress UspA family protein
MAAIVTRILVPIDFGPASEAALQCAEKLAARFGARVALLHVVEFEGAEWCSEPFAHDMPDTVAATRRDADFRLGLLLERLERMEIDATADVVVGDAGRAIAAYARTHDVDLIVMGTHGRCGFAHTMLGSIAERTIRSAPCPVLTLGAQTKPLETARAARDDAIPAV